MILMGDEVVLWQPAARHLIKSHETGASPFGPDVLLSLVEDGIIKIAGRRKLIESPIERNRPGSWEGQHWFEPFDSRIRAIANEDERGQAQDARVILLGDEAGSQFADEQIGLQSPEFHVAKSLVGSERLPLGTRERIGRLKDRQGVLTDHESSLLSTRAFLRDACNHRDALSAVGADLPIYANPYPLSEFNAIGRVPPVASHNPKLSTPEILDFFGWIASLPGSGSPRALTELAKSKDYRGRLWDLMFTEHPLAQLRDNIKDGQARGGLLKQAYSTSMPLEVMSLASFSVSLGSLAATYISLRQTKRWFCQAGLLSVASAALSAAPLAYEGLRRESVIGDDAYHGEVWPFVLANGTVNPTRAQIRALLENIDSRLRTLVKEEET